jgi:hypothetical protein
MGRPKGSKNGIRKPVPENMAYVNARHRCNNPKNKRYEDYGGRGIKFLFTSFEEFITHIGSKPSPELQLDRIENDGNYEIGNVRWATWEQQRENKRKHKVHSDKGKHHSYPANRRKKHVSQAASA